MNWEMNTMNTKSKEGKLPTSITEICYRARKIKRHGTSWWFLPTSVMLPQKLHNHDQFTPQITLDTRINILY